MLIVLVPLLAALAPALSPSSSPVPSPPSTLQEIGHVEALSVCSAVVVHANSAISVALENDSNLALMIRRLRTTDLDDDNPIKRRNGMNDLATLAGRIRAASVTGTGEIKRLRKMAAETTEPTRKVELKSFADALSGAITRQRKAAVDLDKMLAIIDGRRAVAEVNSSELADERTAIAGAATNRTNLADDGVMRSPGAAGSADHVNDVLHSVADDFESRAHDILIDEGTAADHSLGATTGC
jgi:hypothetical protein